jgi:tetratricopeptide (TPR) repeat protein
MTEQRTSRGEPGLDTAALLRRGIAAARVGDREEARRTLRQVTELDEENEEAWLWLSGVVDDRAEKRACFQRVLAINPDNEEARMGLELLGPKREEAAPADEVLHCAYHPDRETLLRCNKCGKPICAQCAVRTPVGYRCKECVAEQQAIFYTAETYDYPIAALIGFPASVLGVFLYSLFSPGFFFGFFVALFVGPAAGGAIAEVIRRAVRRRRGRHLGAVACGAVILGALVVVLLPAILGLGPRALLVAPFAILSRPDLWILVALAVTTIYARLR